MATRKAEIGLTLQPDLEFLELAEPLFTEVDLFEVTPETLWLEEPDGRLEPNGYHARFRELKARTGKAFVAHGVGLSVGGVGKGTAAHHARWLRAVGRDHDAFRFLWYTEHLGWTLAQGRALALPLPAPMTPESARVIRRTLRKMQRVVPHVGLENTAQYFLLGDPLDEPDFLREVLCGRSTDLLLDLHNVFTMAVNFGFDPLDYIRRLPLEKVLEIHLSGGSMSPAGWLPSRRSLRLDAHDGSVPEQVWRLLDEVLPLCCALRAVTLERMEGTLTAADVPLVCEELRRMRTALRGAS